MGNASRRTFPAQEAFSMNNFKLTDLGAPTESGDAVRWDDLQIGLNFITGVEWDTSNSSPALKHIDAYGTEITKTAEQWVAWFNAHPIHGNMWRCLLSAAGVPSFGSNARGDGLVLNGSAGQVMVRIPKFYVKAEKVGTIIRWWISPIAFTGFEVHPAFKQRGGTERAQIYVGAYAACLAVTAAGTKYLLSKTGEQPFTGGEIVEVDFNSGSVAPQIGEVLTGATSLMKGTVVAFYVSTGTWAGGDAAGKIYLKTVSRRLTFTSGAHEPVVGELVNGQTSGATGLVSKVVLTSGAWDGSGAGYILLEGGSGNGYAYTAAGENIRDPSNNVIATGSSDGGTLGQFTIGGAFDGATGGADMMTCQSVGSALSLTRQLSETYGNNIGSRWGCENIWTLDAISHLYLIEYANWDSQSTTVGIGQGIVNKSAGRRYNGEVNGALSADSNIGTNGTGSGTGTDGLRPIAFRGIENPWGNVWQFVIGLDALDAAYRVLKRDGAGTPACPLTAGNYESSVAAPVQYNVSTNPDGYAKDILFEDLTEYLFLANLGAGSSSTYLCDYIYWHRAGQTNILLAGGSWASGAACGVGCRYLYNVASYSFRSIGARVEFV